MKLQALFILTATPGPPLNVNFFLLLLLLFFQATLLYFYQHCQHGTIFQNCDENCRLLSNLNKIGLDRSFHRKANPDVFLNNKQPKITIQITNELNKPRPIFHNCPCLKRMMLL